MILWRKSQLSRFAEMVSQVLESGRLRVNKSKLEVLVGAAGPGARRINAESARGAYQFTLRSETTRAITIVETYTVFRPRFLSRVVLSQFFLPVTVVQLVSAVLVFYCSQPVCCF